MNIMKIQNAEVQELLVGKMYEYPKYVTQILNLANANTQGTRPKVVGQMSDLIQKFDGKTVAEWSEWYLERYPNSIDVATDKVFVMIDLLRNAIDKIDRDMVRMWVEELVIVKTYAGLKFQDAILRKISDRHNKSYRLSTRYEESSGIDGYIGTRPVSIKPNTYRAMMALNESIDVSIIFYEKRKNDIVVEYDDDVCS